jgi:flagellar basal body P-ring formation protein FlgA
MPYLFLIAALTSPAFEDLEILDERILAVSEHAEQIDKRLKLAECPDEPIIAPPAGGTVIVRCPALGWRLRVPLKTPSAAVAAAEIVVRKGELVECVSGGPGFAVSTPMIALEDAGIGQPVRVKSPSSPIPITATVKSRGLVSF